MIFFFFARLQLFAEVNILFSSFYFFPLSTLDRNKIFCVIYTRLFFLMGAFDELADSVLFHKMMKRIITISTWRPEIFLFCNKKNKIKVTQLKRNIQDSYIRFFSSFLCGFLMNKF